MVEPDSAESHRGNDETSRAGQWVAFRTAGKIARSVPNSRKSCQEEENAERPQKGGQAKEYILLGSVFFCAVPPAASREEPRPLPPFLNRAIFVSPGFPADLQQTPKAHPLAATKQMPRFICLLLCLLPRLVCLMLCLRF